MEKMLTTSVEDLDRFRKSASAEGVTQEERTAREAYNYTKVRARRGRDVCPRGPQTDDLRPAFRTGPLPSHAFAARRP